MIKNLKITIKKRKDSSLTEDIGELELGLFTIFAGENNAGKTNLIKVIIEELEKDNINVINIPAERVLPDVEIKTGAEGDPFRLAIRELLEVDFKDEYITSAVKDIDKLLPLEFSKFSVEKTELLAKTKINTITNDDYIKAIKDVYAKKLIDSLTTKDCYSNKEGIKLSEVGQGTQRLIIASLLKYLGSKKGEKFSNKLTYIVFEEPEIYLHPKLKETLFNSLIDLVENSNEKIKVIITTHDPYFIDLGKDFKIYRVDRSGTDNATKVKEILEERSLPYKSSSEINYLVFRLPSKTYFLELYQFVKDNSKLEGEVFEKFILSKISNKTEYSNDNTIKWKLSYVSRLRHNIAHPIKTEDRKTKIELIEKLDDAIKDLLKINTV
ncbi:MAG: AAA family ATPase [Candidatus Paceibacterota bacterium]